MKLFLCVCVCVDICRTLSVLIRDCFHLKKKIVENCFLFCFFVSFFKVSRWQNVLFFFLIKIKCCKLCKWKMKSCLKNLKFKIETFQCYLFEVFFTLVDELILCLLLSQSVSSLPGFLRVTFGSTEDDLFLCKWRVSSLSGLPRVPTSVVQDESHCFSAVRAWAV